jgi:hypothetical protein
MKHGWYTIGAVLLTCASMPAQRVGSGPHFGARPGFHSGVAHHRNWPAFYPLPFFDPAYTDYFPESSLRQPSQPTLVVVQPPPPAVQAVASAPAPSEPLMIELRGDNYVQVSGNSVSQAKLPNVRSDASIFREKRQPASTRAPENQPALLVFRDGHSEQVSSYTIADGTIYAKADYYIDGAWNRKIPISSLNVADTIHSNEARGLAFHLPSAPNEVVVGP